MNDEISTPQPHEIVTPFEARLSKSVSAPREGSNGEPRPGGQAQIAIADGQMQLCSIEQVWRVAKLIRQSGLCPKSFSNDQQVVIAILRALELKIHIFQAMEGMAIINGKVTIGGDLALALVERSGLLKEISQASYSGEGDAYACTLVITRKGRKAQSSTFSVAQAKLAGLWGKAGPWTQYPDRMLKYRALGWGLRDQFSDVLKGIKTSEEVADYNEH